jgi:cysteine desulfurase / selenocysteine lyase
MTMNTNGLENHHGHQPSDAPLSIGESLEANLFEPSVIQAIANQFYTAIPTQNSSQVSGGAIGVAAPEAAVAPLGSTPDQGIPGAALSGFAEPLSAQMPQIYPPVSSSSSIASPPEGTNVVPQDGTVSNAPSIPDQGISGGDPLTEIVKQLQCQLLPLFSQGSFDSTLPTLPVDPNPMVPAKQADLSGIPGSPASPPSPPTGGSSGVTEAFAAVIPQIYPSVGSGSEIPGGTLKQIAPIPEATNAVPQDATVSNAPSIPESGTSAMPQNAPVSNAPSIPNQQISGEALMEIAKKLQGQIPLVFPQGILDTTTPTPPVEPSPIIPGNDRDLLGGFTPSTSVPSGVETISQPPRAPENQNFDAFTAIAQQLYTQIPQIYPGSKESGPISPPSGFSQILPLSEGDLQHALKEVHTQTQTPGAPDNAQPSFYFLSEPQLGNLGLESHEGFDVYAVRRDFPILHQKVHGKPLIWFDNGATTQKPQSVIDSISRFYERDNSNIHRGAHDLAARSTDAYEGAREKVQRFLGASSAEEIVFVRGTTEGVNLVAQTYGRKYIREGDEIILTTLEHHANIVPWQMLAQEKGAVLKVVPITDRGEVILEEYTRLLGPRTRIVAVTQVSNSLGTIVPVQEMTAIAHRHGARVLIDGAQAVSHFPVNVQQLDADFYVFSGHKLFAPTGIGVVYAKRELLEDMPPWQGGGNMIRHVTFEKTTYSDPPAKFEAGTPNIADAVGLGAAIDYLNRLGMVNIEQYEHKLTEYGMERLRSVPGLRLIGTAPNKVGVLSFILDDIPYEEVGKRLASEGIAVRAGHHCAQPSLQRYGLTGTVRPSLAFYNTREEIDTLVEVLRSIRYR